MRCGPLDVRRAARRHGGGCYLRADPLATIGCVALRDPGVCPNQRSDALIFASVAAPGHSAFASSVLNGAATVLRCPCRSCAALST